MALSNNLSVFSEEASMVNLSGVWLLLYSFNFLQEYVCSENLSVGMYLFNTRWQSLHIFSMQGWMVFGVKMKHIFILVSMPRVYM